MSIFYNECTHVISKSKMPIMKRNPYFMMIKLQQLSKGITLLLSFLIWLIDGAKCDTFD